MKYKYLGLYDSSLLRCTKRKVGDFMCQRLTELNGKSAEEILKSSGQANNVPVDLEKIIETIRVYKHPRTFEDIEKIKNREVAGLVLFFFLGGNTP